VELCAFTKELMHQVMSVFKKEDQPVEVKIDMPLTLITIDTAVPLGLILNELMTNSFKYALENGKNGTISIQLLPGDVDKGWMLIYRDNGKGLPQNQDINLAKTLGLRLVSRLSKQIKGSSEYRYDGGAEFTIRFRTAS
jgi:two-component sensor histidine kinase